MPVYLGINSIRREFLIGYLNTLTWPQLDFLLRMIFSEKFTLKHSTYSTIWFTGYRYGHQTISNDTKTGIYYTNVTVGKPSLVVNLAVDVRGSALWFQCDKLGYNSTNYTPILCGNDTCHAYLQTQMTYNTVLASLVKDDVVLSYTSPSTKLAARLPLACMSASEVVAGLPYGTQGILGLGNSSTSSVKVMVSSYKIPFKVALCLPSKPGNDFGPVYIGPPNRKDVRRLLVSTSLVSIPETRERGEDNYYIDTSHWGGTKIPYTLLETSIYKALVKAFVGKAQKQKAAVKFKKPVYKQVLFRSHLQ
ncbi:hypothetical protein YC2023_006226 [Brassica napus]